METAGLSKKSLLETFNTARSKQLNELRKENEICDLTLKCEDGFEIKVHRVVVTSASNYFKDLLTLPMKEKFEECISMPDITGDVLEKIITFIYTTEFEEEIEDVEKIIEYALIFQLQELVEICSLALSEAITDHTCMKYWRYAKKNFIYSLVDKCLSYIASKADHVFENSLMSDLTIEEMKCLLADNRFHFLHDEKAIFEHVRKWAKGKVSETKSFCQVFSEVADLFNYAELNQEFIHSRIFLNDDFTENAELLQKIAKLIKQKSKDEVPSCPITLKSTQRLFGLIQKKTFIGLGEGNTINKEINLPVAFGYTVFENKLLICGGRTEHNSSTTSCQFFEPYSKLWKKFPSMKTERSEHECLYLGNKIYACGGLNTKTVEIFDLAKGEWDYGPEMLANNSRFGLSGVNGALYAIGGKTGDITILDPRTQKWNVVCSDSCIDRYVRCVSIGPCIYCFTSSNRYIFDTRANEITEKIHYANFCSYSSFCEHDGFIYGLRYHQGNRHRVYSLDFFQHHLDGNVGFTKSCGVYDSQEQTYTAIVSLYY